MSHKYPLQPGDRTQGQSGLTETSTAADRRPTSQDGFANQPGENAAPSFGRSEDPIYKIGYLDRTPKHAPPYEVINMAGDTSGTGTQEFEIDICEYGDAYDPTAPIRTREVGSDWRVDSDGDGTLN